MVSGAEGEVRSVLGFKDEQRIKEDEERRKDLELKIPVLREYRERMINITLKKYAPGCVFCGSIEDDMIRLYGKYVCRKCIKAMARGE